MGKYTPSTTVGSNGLTTTKMTDGNGVTVSNRKGNIRNALIEAGIDPEDSITDTAKIASLTLSMVCSMYTALPEEVKSLIPVEKRTHIDYIVDKFATVNTLADIQLLEEGTDLIDALLENQALIAKIVSSTK